MDTPPSIRRQYASPPRESPDQRRRRLANRRAAKYRHFKALSSSHESLEASSSLQRQKNTLKQRQRRSLQDDATRDRVRAQNRRRQQLRRQSLSDKERADIREKQRERQRQRRQTLNQDAREELRERERLRIRRRRHRLKTGNDAEQEPFEQVNEEKALPSPAVPLEQDRLPLLRLNTELPTLRQHQERQRDLQRLPFGDGGQITLPPPPPVAFHERILSLPHIQQVTRTQATTLLHSTPPPLFPRPGTIASAGNVAAVATSSGLPSAVASAVAAAATRPPHPTPIMPPVSLSLSNKPLGALPMVAHQQNQSQQQQPRTPIVLPPAHRSLPPLPDFLSSREAFNPANAAGIDARLVRRSTGANRTLFPSISDLPATHTDAQESENFFQR
ncbi:hypothetical protein PHYBOEH_009485 [Phytophthora boehmeriae]|uniref:Uncharacterized protein n=1 Tax=Phytophthora boehmeriae TaxID=109152 RepID=A0A8T1X7C0_9STRA|nr:hypothetical protein PHYBOEH_009485 [Phytophthora boehmeriae]